MKAAFQKCLPRSKAWGDFENDHGLTGVVEDDLTKFKETISDQEAIQLAWQIQNAQRKTVIATKLGAQWHTPEPLPTGTTTAVDRYNSAAGYLSKHYGFVTGLLFRLSAVFKALISFRFGLLSGLLSGQKIDGTQSSL